MTLFTYIFFANRARKNAGAGKPPLLGILLGDYMVSGQ